MSYTNEELRTRLNKGLRHLTEENRTTLLAAAALMGAERKCSVKRLPKACLETLLSQARHMYREQQAQRAEQRFDNNVLSAKEKFLQRKRAFIEGNKAAVAATRARMEKAKALAQQLGRSVTVSEVDEH